MSLTNMLSLIRNENMKIYRRISTWILLGILITFVTIFGVALKVNTPEGITMWTFIEESSGLTAIITLFTVIIAGGIVATEFTQGTIKLLLIRPVSRTKILLSKYLSTMFFALTTLMLLFVTAFLLGGLLFGFESFTDPYIAPESTLEKSMFGHVLSLYGLNFVDVVMMSTFAFMISTVFRSSSLSIGLAIFLMFAGTTAVMLLIGIGYEEWAKYLLFAHTDLSQHINNRPLIEGTTMRFSISVLIVYFATFVGLSWVVFNKRDVAA
ncbi:ABC transporter permease [Cytobacillus sp. Hm23]